MVDYKKRAERRREYYEKIVSNRPYSGVGAPLEGEALVTLARSGLENISRAQSLVKTRGVLSAMVCCVVRCGLGTQLA